jgi:hypothetical protein
MIPPEDLTGLTLDERLRLVTLEAEEGGLPQWVKETVHQVADVLEGLRWDLVDPPEPPRAPRA